MEVVPTVKKLQEATERLSNSSKEVFKLSKKRAMTEREYRKALSKEIVTLRADNVQATLIPDLARGNTSELKFKRDLAMEMHRSAMSSIGALQTEVQSWQSILKYMSDV